MLSATIVFLSYRDRQWVDAALDGVLAQTVPCQLLISNDAADDGTFERITERLQGYQGHHRIDLLLKQPQNLGVVGSCNAVLPQASGDIVVMMAGDDVSAPDRVEKLLAAYAQYPQTMAIGTDFAAVDGEDRPVAIDFKTEMLHFDLHRLAHSRAFHTLLGAALSFRREVFTRFGSLRGTVEDNALTLRACLLGDCRNLPEKLVRYRQHSGSVSHGVFARSGADARELKRRRYLRTAAFLQGTADDLAHCLTQLPNLEAEMMADARRLQRMYAGAARMRQALVTGDFAERWSAMCSALAQPGNRRRALEYASKLWRK
ncbi:hypothetical protein CO615_11075 [Lysobacteraceae bacterium NML75-0749]|nr:hypothetical protein CO615_11075 [Xanthomonadaceae bacterium NML75-0749]PJK03289.1 hypothetical protein CO609_07890 [Xanthomonadaceae bacterium NML91-0268]